VPYFLCFVWMSFMQYAFSLPNGHQTPLEWYQALQTQVGFVYDPMQALAIARLDQLYHELVKFKQHRWFGRWFNTSTPQGLYFYGGVGRGKSLLMDAFFACVPYQRKRRVHFHAFMQEVHQALSMLKGEIDPLASVAKRIAKTTCLLCFDELHVSDIADAMILGRLFAALFKQGVIFVVTSNYAPEGLYPQGLQRSNFLPTITLLKEKLEIVELEGGVDYRLRRLQRARIWLSPLDNTTDLTLNTLFSQLMSGAERSKEIVINGRVLHSKRHATGMIWFTFAELCMTARAQGDYLALSRHYHTVFLSDIPHLTQAQANAARRFTWLVDVFYNERIKLIVSSETMPDRLYAYDADEFARTQSRLEEMQSHAYLSLSKGS
jgi:cell division protein ZapE